MRIWYITDSLQYFLHYFRLYSPNEKGNGRELGLAIKRIEKQSSEKKVFIS